MVQSGLVFHAPLHEASGRANDLSGNDNHANITSPNSQGVSGVGGLTAYDFTGVFGDYVQIPHDDDLSLSDQLTVSAWCRPRALASGDTNDDYDMIFEKGDTSSGDREYLLRFSNNTGINQFYVYDNGGISYGVNGTKPKNNEWVHVTGVYNNGTLLIYQNGELDGVNNIENITENTTTITATIGSFDNTAEFFDGLISDVRVYNRALSPSEIQHLYEIGSVDVATPPAEEDSAAVARYAFDDRSDPTTALDTFGANDGTINGATYSADAIRGLSMSFDGSNDYIEIPDSASLSFGDEITISTWIKSVSDGNFHGIVNKYDGTNSGEEIRYFKRIGGTLTFEIVDSSGNSIRNDSNLSVSDNNWVHTAVSYSAVTDEVKHYINGVLDNDTSLSSADSLKDTTVPLIIGASQGGTTTLFNGNMDDIRIYDRALSDQEIHQLYNWGTRGTDRRYELIRK